MKDEDLFPDLTGLHIRNYQDEEDQKDIIRIWNGCVDADGLDHPLTEEELSRTIEHLTHCDPGKDILLVDIDGEAVSCSMLWWDDEPGGKRLYRYHLKVLPGYRDTGITDGVIRWLESRARERARDHPDKEKVFHICINEEEEYLSTALKFEGYEFYRYGLKMVRPDLEDIPDTSLPEGVEIREVKEEDLDKIRKAWNRACEDLRSQVPISRESWEQWKEDDTFDTSLWSIAWNGDEVVGTCLGMIDKDENEANGTKRGYTEFISTKKGWRGKGIAKALMADTLRKLRDAGMEEAALGVDAENPSGALNLYEKMGYEKVGQMIFYRKPLEQDEDER